MDKSFIYTYIKQHTLAVLSTTATSGKPESALIGVAVSENLKIIFDIVRTSRKYHNILQNPKTALVIGWDNETTLQYEGIAEILEGPDAERYKEIYFAAFPDGRHRAATWQDIVHIKVTPTWIRYSNFNEPHVIDEFIP